MTQALAFLRHDLCGLLRSAVRARRDLREVCGLLFDNGVHLELVALPNVRAEICSASLDPRDVSQAIDRMSRLQWRLVGTYHSHVVSDPVPGATDIECALGSLMFIVDASSGRMRLWRIDGRSAVELPFEILPPSSA